MHRHKHVLVLIYSGNAGSGVVIFTNFVKYPFGKTSADANKTSSHMVESGDGHNTNAKDIFTSLFVLFDFPAQSSIDL